MMTPMRPVADETAVADDPVKIDGPWTARVKRTRRAQQAWAALTPRQRAPFFRRYAASIAHRADALTTYVTLPQRTRAETFTSELLPLADAARYLALEGPRLLQSRWASRIGRPMWARQVAVETRREPWGIVLIVGPSNYPLLLPGVQLLQALMAGNGVWLKPGRDSTECAQALRMLWIEAGGPPDLIEVLPEEVDAVNGALEAGVEHVVLTGSTMSGRAVLRLAAETITPTTMELSGCDAVIVQGTADVELAARAILFGLVFNGSATCMAPRRVLASADRIDDLVGIWGRDVATWVRKPVAPAASEAAKRLIEQAITMGARLRLGAVPDDDRWAPVILSDVTPDMPLAKADLFVPVTSCLTVTDDEDALRQLTKCPYALGAAVFGEAHSAANLARRIPAGCVVVNDLIAPTADPRVAFGGWNSSGFGATRGPEGLLRMTRPQVIVEQRGRWRPHLDPAGEPPLDLVRGLLNLTHGLTWRQRWQGMRDLWRVVRTMRRAKASPPKA